MKKVILFGSIVVLIFVALIVVSNINSSQKAAGNPFEKDRLDPATIELLDDPNYQNVILPSELAEKMANEETATVYFYSPKCAFCKEATPTLVQLTDEKGIDLVQYNVLEFEEGWDAYNIDSTPTVIHFENGVEVQRIVGLAPEQEYNQFFDEYVVN
ncbi:thioredoxin family protein [Alkalihalobacillus sp. MEB130]|uniref:thioredoxin family protein n=1 Tax=Alkalihalobacillus sp. MEB130 TaxID=2976704 RepID=UPI0028DF8D0B|nr:thioredoxin family protein [Alkalihalobacillus sp. MEB130]MDT8859540.1 thioredoxin family protein [Alkalihalobacillus sp. MEB130]